MRVLIFAAFLALCGCATVKLEEVANRPANVETFASVGDVMLRVDVRESLPNIYGRADIYGRKRDRGFSEIRYMGVAPDGSLIFRRRDVDIITTEDTMTRSGLGTATVVAQPSGRGVVVSGVTTRAPEANVQLLPPDTTEFVLDLSLGRLITIRGKTIEVMSADQNGIRFIVR